MNVFVFAEFIDYYNLKEICNKFNIKLIQNDTLLIPNNDPDKPDIDKINIRTNILKTNVKIFFDESNAENGLKFSEYLVKTGNYNIIANGLKNEIVKLGKNNNILFYTRDRIILEFITNNSSLRE